MILYISDQSEVFTYYLDHAYNGDDPTGRLHNLNPAGKFHRLLS
jgi:hypothetical protein